jgi:HD-GYP domain-containing protein (c-di-GMP phosphodiesterase class II)
VGHLQLPDDLVPLAVLALVYLLVSRLLLQVVGGLEVLQPDFAAAAAEAGLGAILALFALNHPWNVIAVVPLALAVNHAHARVRRSRQETLHALETFANIVDERDPWTYRHSVRVAGYVDSLARALGLPYSDIDRLRWAARLHDLGKVAVDASVLSKPGKLRPNEWGTVWRAPRLSARLLRRFEVSAAEARAVEYHRERYDGRGYYGIPAEDQPLAAHFLVVADSFDAMTSDRPYRAGLSRDEALAEIERNIGTQFHPTVAKAFVALQRGQDPFSVLTTEEREEIRGASTPYRVPDIRGARRLRERPELVALAGVIAALGGVGLEPALAVVAEASRRLWPGGGFGPCQVWMRLPRQPARPRARRTALAAGAAQGLSRALELLARDGRSSDWVALVEWQGGRLGGRDRARALATGPSRSRYELARPRGRRSRDDSSSRSARSSAATRLRFPAPPRENSAGSTPSSSYPQPERDARTSADRAHSSLDAIGLALAPRPAEAEPDAVTAATG